MVVAPWHVYSSRSPTAQTQSRVQHLYRQRRTILHEGITGRPIQSSCYTMIRTRPVIHQVQTSGSRPASPFSSTTCTHVGRSPHNAGSSWGSAKLRGCDTMPWHLHFCYHATATIIYPDALYLFCISSVHISLARLPRQTFKLCTLQQPQPWA